MSADLFAEFENFAAPAPSQGSGPKKDPFAFSTSVTPAQSNQAGAQPFSWQPAPSQPATSTSSNLWGDLSSLGQPSSIAPASSSALNQPSQDPFSWGVAPSQPAPALSSWGGFSSLATPGTAATTITAQNAQGDDDDWGDFEDAPNPDLQASSKAPAQALPVPAAPTAPSRDAPEPRNRIVRASTLDLISNNLVDVMGSPPRKPAGVSNSAWAAATSPKVTRARQAKLADPNVLFDADDFDEAEEDDDDDDEFGDFEMGTEAAAMAPVPPQPQFDLLGGFEPVASKAAPSPIVAASSLLADLAISDTAQPDKFTHKRGSSSVHSRSGLPGLTLSTAKAAAQEKAIEPPAPVTSWPSFDEGKKAANEDDDPWGVFEDLPAKEPVKKTTPAPVAAKADSSWDWGDEDATSSTPAAAAITTAKATSTVLKNPTAASTITALGISSTTLDDNAGAPPPTNIPPPAVLLSLLPSLIALAEDSLFKPLSAATASSSSSGGAAAAVRARVLSDPATQAFLRGYLVLAAVAARVLAGRKLRWQRDKFLAQGMAISAAGAKGGMKLAAVDRAQAAREDAEAADVLAAWRAAVGKLRGAVAGANTAAAAGGRQQQQQLKVPELAETMAVTTARQVPTAPKACVVCGLRREERVAKVDTDVEDSFGEWWVDHWGHRACRNFWLEHEARLRSR